MVGKKAKQLRSRTFTDLAERAASDEDARAALDRYRAIKEAGGIPEIWYSDFGGWHIRDAIKGLDE
jgi:hypothetical protein